MTQLKSYNGFFMATYALIATFAVSAYFLIASFLGV